MKQYHIITTLFDDALLLVVSVFVRCPCMAINVSAQQNNAGLLPDIRVYC